MKHSLQIVLGIVIVGFIAVFTKPSDEKCKTRVSNVVEAFAKDKVQSESVLADRINEKVSDENVLIEDKLFYKEITVTSKGDAKTVAYGLFGFVKIKQL